MDVEGQALTQQKNPVGTPLLEGQLILLEQFR